MSEDLIARIKEAVIKGAKDVSLPLVEEVIANGVTAERILEDALTPAMLELGKMWNRGEIFIPEVMGGAQVFN
ncbi:MAG: hypothetical protein HPY58_03145 [Firmicutes bacterium]|nr:hypothetical protein [Bacillota bacterium]